MDERQEKRRMVRDIMSVCQSRYVLPELAGEYLKLYELAKKLYDAVNLTDLKFDKRYWEVIDRFNELEERSAVLRKQDAPPADPPEPPKKKRGGMRAGAGRKGKGYVRRKTTISLPPEYWEMFDTMAEHLEMDQAALIREMITTAIDDHMDGQDYVTCPVCDGAGEIQPKKSAEPVVCTGCDGKKKLQQGKLRMEKDDKMGECSK